MALYADIDLTSTALDSFFWQPTLNMTCPTCASPVVAPLADQTYTLTAYTQGCKLSASTNIRVVLPNDYYIPNAFTPNGDNINDEFFIYAQSGVTVYRFEVFNRWGEKVHDSVFPWNGTYKGGLCLPDVYVYVFDLGFFGSHEGKVAKGSVTLIR